MEPTGRVSITEKVMSRCQLNECCFILKDTPLGICLQWLYSEDGSKNSKPIPTAFVGKIKTDVKLHPVCLNSTMEAAIFGKVINPDSCDSTETGHVAVLVECKTGEVMAAHTKLPGCLKNLCRATYHVVWTGILDVDGTQAVVVVSKESVVSFGVPAPYSVFHASHKVQGKYGECNLVWRTKTLTSLVMTCCGHKDALVFSDGIQSYLYLVSVIAQDRVEVRSHKLPYAGVIKITCENVDRIEMFTCDGRKYQCSWEVLTAHNKDDNPKVNSMLHDHELPCTYDGMMAVVRRCSDLMDDEENSIESMDLYLRQLRLAHRLLSEPQLSLFSTDVRVEQNIEQKESYLVHIQYDRVNKDVDLDGQWWRLSIVILRLDGTQLQVFNTKLDSGCFKRTLCLSITLPALDLSSVKGRTVESYLVLEHFSSSRPVCRVLACTTTIDILHFLTYEHNLSTDTKQFTSSDSGSTFQKAVKGTTECTDSKSCIHRDLILICRVSFSYIVEDNTSLFGPLLTFTPLDPEGENSVTNNHQITLWYHSDCVHLQFSTKGNKTIVTLEGSKPSVVLSLKVALQRRVRKHRQISAPVTHSLSVLKQARDVHSIVIEENSESTQMVISHLHHTITNLISLLPL